MKNNATGKIYSIFQYLFLVLMGLVLSFILPALFSAAAVSYFCIMAAVFSGIFFILYRKNISDRVYAAVISVMTISMLVFQILYFRQGVYVPKPPGDPEAVYVGVKELVINGRFLESNWYYLAYPHQLFSTFIYAVANRVFVYAGMEGPISHFATYTLNAFMTCMGFVLFCLGIKRISDNKISLFSGFLFFVNLSYYSSVRYIYPHELSVFFICAVIFLSCVFFTEKRNKQRYLKAAALGFTTAVALSVEGIFAIALIAVAIVIMLLPRGTSRVISEILCLSAGFFIALLLINLLYASMSVIDRTDEEKYKFPVSHWIAMGLSESGMFNQDDYDIVIGSETKLEKQDQTASLIKERFTSRGLFETIGFYYNKEKTVWIGSFYGQSISAIDRSAYNKAYRGLLFVMIFLSQLFQIIQKKKAYEKKDIENFAFAKIWICGLFLFFLIWEVSPVYLFSSLPIVIFAASQAFVNIDYLNK